MINTPSQRFSSHNYYDESPSNGYDRNQLNEEYYYQVFDGNTEYVWKEDGIFSVSGWDGDLDLTELDEEESKEAYFVLVKQTLENDENEFICHKGEINEYWVANYQICEERIYKVTWNEEDCCHDYEEATPKECEWVLDQANASIENCKAYREGRK